MTDNTDKDGSIDGMVQKSWKDLSAYGIRIGIIVMCAFGVLWVGWPNMEKAIVYVQSIENFKEETRRTMVNNRDDLQRSIINLRDKDVRNDATIAALRAALDASSQRVAVMENENRHYVERLKKLETILDEIMTGRRRTIGETEIRERLNHMERAPR